MKLRHYETFYLLHPDLSDEERTSISEQLQQIVTKGNGEIVKINPWPLQKLAYRVQKQTQGYYVVTEYGALAESISEITRRLRLNEGVMKFVTTKLSNKFDAEALAKARNESAPPVETVEEVSDSTQSTEKREEE
ncbi:MAG: 30S ribosomal protein S6 [Deltaproteobacteria bacterium]|nr:30S ribosomal protein S6 [Deltaproteobacteria bacterium]MDL1960769.1 30S ribosomal protein S6 [Deltaproteobacteria bacterium]